MFNSRLSWLPPSLLCLLFASPVLSARPTSTTPYDPFHAIAALAPKPREEPICCLKPLTPLEPVDDDLFLSFEDWKAKRLSESNNNSQKGSHHGAPPNDSAPTLRAPDESGAAEQHASAALMGAAHTLDASADSAPTMPGPDVGTTTPAPPPHFRVPLTDRFNYASLDCSARVHTAHRGAKSASSILSSKRDRYMLSPCGAAAQFVVVELCEDIRIDTVQLANFEFFSGVFKEFTVSVAKTYATDAEGWTVVGTYVGKNVRGVQSFHPPMNIRDFYRYIRIDFHSHYSNEYYCPISLLRVYGLTHLEQWKWDIWEEESRSKARQDPKATNPIVYADVILETEKPADEHMASQAQVASSSPTPSPDTQEQSSSSPELVEGSFRHSTDIARLEPSTSPTASSESPTIATCLPPASPPLNSDQDPINDSHILSSNDTSTASSSVSLLSSRQANAPGTSPSASRSSSPSTTTTVSSPSMTQASPSAPVINLPPLPSPMNVHAGGESIYRTIMNRLNALEANTTLYARYVEEQTNAMRDMLRRMSEDVGRLEGIGRAQAQLFERVINDFERHRREMDIEQRTLISQVNYLAEEVVLEKRLGIAQLCLLLAVLVFLSVTRGSPGEFHAPPRRTNTMREWGRRSLGLSSDWVSRLRSGPPPQPHDKNAPAPAPALAPPPTSTLAPPTADPFTTIVPPVTTTPTTSRHRRPPLFLTPTHRAPAQRSAGLARPRTASHAPPPPVVPILMPAPSPVRRSSSHGNGAPFIGPVPRSARRWARSAHLHEVRRAAAVPQEAVADVFGRNKGRSAPSTAVTFVREGNGNGMLRVRPASATRDAGVGVGVGVGAAETWVDTDTDADAEGSEVGVWEIDDAD